MAARSGNFDPPPVQSDTAKLVEQAGRWPFLDAREQRRLVDSLADAVKRLTADLQAESDRLYVAEQGWADAVAARDRLAEALREITASSRASNVAAQIAREALSEVAGKAEA